MARTLLTSLIPILPRNLRHLNVKRKNSKQKASTKARKIWYAFSPAGVLYPNFSCLQFDSEDEREAAEAQKALTHKIRSQSIKKSKKNQARLPRTAGLRTISELSTELKKAGYDPSSIEARAGILAKVQAAKRKRAEADMDVDMDDAEEADEIDEVDAGEWMDVDGEEPPTSKRAKGNSGAVIARNSRAPRTNRQLGGMRDDQVNNFYLLPTPV